MSATATYPCPCCGRSVGSEDHYIPRFHRPGAACRKEWEEKAKTSGDTTQKGGGR